MVATVIRPEDLRIESVSAGDTWVRVTHLPTGEVESVDATEIGRAAACEKAVGAIEARLAARDPSRIASSILDAYLLPDPPDGWHLIDNADADDVRHALELAIERIRAVLKQCDRAGMIPLPGDDGCSGRMIDADRVARDLHGEGLKP